MNNRVTMVVFICANILFGILIYRLFFAKENISINSATAISLILMCLGFYSFSIGRFMKSNEK